MYTGQLHQSLYGLLLGGESLGVTHWVRRLIIGTYIYMFTIWWERLEETLFKLNGFWCISSCLCTCKKTTLFGRLVRFHLKFIFGFFSTSFKETLNCEVSPFLFLNLKLFKISFLPCFFLFQSIKINRIYFNFFYWMTIYFHYCLLGNLSISFLKYNENKIFTW